MPVPKTVAGVLALALASALLAAGCGKEDEEDLGVDEPVREGLAIPLAGVEYNVFLTRQLNTELPEDKAYFTGEQPPGDRALYAVFIQACNNGEEPAQALSDFVVNDSQGNEFEPEQLPEDNAFAYQSEELLPHECIPRSGSLAQLGPTGGAMLLFELPLEATENRPLELEMQSFEGEVKRVELDI